MDKISSAALTLARKHPEFRRQLIAMLKGGASRIPGNESKGPREEDEEDEGWDPGEVVGEEKAQNAPKKTAGKKERRSQKDKRRSDKMKGKRDSEPKAKKDKGPKSQEQKKRDKETRKRQVEKGKFGLPGAGRGGKHESKKDKAKRPDRKQKHKGKPMAASLEAIRAVMAAKKYTKRQLMSVQQKHGLPGKVDGRGDRWTLEVKNDRDKKAWEKALGLSLGGYVTGYGSWMLSPNYQSSGDWNDPSSRHHY